MDLLDKCNRGREVLVSNKAFIGSHLSKVLWQKSKFTFSIGAEQARVQINDMLCVSE